MRKTVVAIFLDLAEARRATAALIEAGYPEADISVAMRERYDAGFGPGASLLRDLPAPNQATTTTMDQGKIDSRGMYETAEAYRKGLGPLVLAGPLARGIGGAALGISAGGLTGALSDIGIPNEVGRDLTDRVRAGERTLVALRVEREKSPEVERLFVEAGADEVYRGVDKASAYTESEQAVRATQHGF
jgi:hypothetical protein